MLLRDVASACGLDPALEGDPPEQRAVPAWSSCSKVAPKEKLIELTKENRTPAAQPASRSFYARKPGVSVDGTDACVEKNLLKPVLVDRLPALFSFNAAEYRHGSYHSVFQRTLISFSQNAPVRCQREPDESGHNRFRNDCRWRRGRGENSVHRLKEEHGDEAPLESVRHAADARRCFAVVVIVTKVYLPILFLQGLEGRMFRPMTIRSARR